MPTYQYACTACGHELEAVQSFTEDPLTECPSCQGHLRKRYGSVGVVFKGSGFYRTDSRANSNDPGNEGTGDKGTSENSGGDKSDGAASGGGEGEGGKSDAGKTKASGDGAANPGGSGGSGGSKEKTAASSANGDKKT